MKKVVVKADYVITLEEVTNNLANIGYSEKRVTMATIVEKPVKTINSRESKQKGKEFRSAICVTNKLNALVICLSILLTSLIKVHTT